jgi:hypothetical protein
MKKFKCINCARESTNTDDTIMMQCCCGYEMKEVESGE